MFKNRESGHAPGNSEGEPPKQQPESVELSAQGTQATMAFVEGLRSSVQSSITQRQGRGGSEILSANYPDIQKAADDYAQKLTLEFPDAAKKVKGLMETTIRVQFGPQRTLKKMSLAEALVDPEVYIPASEDKSGADPVSVVQGLFGELILSNSIGHIRTLKNEAIKQALPSSPVHPMDRRVFGSRGGTIALVTVEVLSVASAIPTYFAVGEVLGPLLPQLPGEVLFAMSAYFAGAVARTVNSYDRDTFKRGMHNARGYWGATADRFRDESPSGRKLFDAKAVKPIVASAEWLAKQAISKYDGARANFKGEPKLISRDTSWTLNPELSVKNYATKAGLIVAFSAATTAWGLVRLATTQDSFEKSLDIAAAATVDQRDQELRAWANTLTSRTDNTSQATVPNLVNAMIEVECNGGTKRVGDNQIDNQTQSGRGVACEFKEKEGPQVTERVRKEADKIILAQRDEIIGAFEVYKKLGMVLPDEKIKELADRYIGIATKITSNNSREDIEGMVDRELAKFGAASNKAEIESRKKYKIWRTDSIKHYDFNLPKPDFKPLDLDLRFERAQFGEVISKKRETEGEIAVLWYILQGIALGLVIEKGVFALFPNILGATSHKLKNAISSKPDAPFVPKTVPGSQGQQVELGVGYGLAAGAATGAALTQKFGLSYGASAKIGTGVAGVISLLGKPYPGAKVEGGLTSEEDKNGRIQSHLDAQLAAGSEIYSTALASINTELSQMMPGSFQEFTPERVKAALVKLVQAEVDKPPLFDQLHEPLMAHSASDRNILDATKRRRQYRTQKRFLADQKNALYRSIQTLFGNGSTRAFEKFVGELMPIKGYRRVFELAKSGKIHDVTRGLEFVQIVWEKTGGNDKLAVEAIDEAARDWRGVEVVCHRYEMLSTPNTDVPNMDQVVGSAFSGPSKSDIAGLPSNPGITRRGAAAGHSGSVEDAEATVHGSPTASLDAVPHSTSGSGTSGEESGATPVIPSQPQPAGVGVPGSARAEGHQPALLSSSNESASNDGERTERPVIAVPGEDVVRPPAPSSPGGAPKDNGAGHEAPGEKKTGEGEAQWSTEFAEAAQNLLLNVQALGKIALGAVSSLKGQGDFGYKAASLHDLVKQLGLQVRSLNSGDQAGLARLQKHYEWFSESLTALEEQAHHARAKEVKVEPLESSNDRTILNADKIFTEISPRDTKPAQSPAGEKAKDEPVVAASLDEAEPVIGQIREVQYNIGDIIDQAKELSSRASGSDKADIAAYIVALKEIDGDLENFAKRNPEDMNSDDVKLQAKKVASIRSKLEL